MICFLNYRLQTAGLLKCLESHLPEHLWRVNMLTGPKHCFNQHGGIFVGFFDQYERKPAPKILS